VGLRYWKRWGQISQEVERMMKDSKDEVNRRDLLKLDAIYRITRLITSEPEVIAERTFYAAMVLSKAEGGSMFLRFPMSGQVLRLVIAENLDVDKKMIKPGRIDKWVLERKQPLLLDANSIPPELKPYLVKPEKVKSSMIVPIVFKEETLGIINLTNKIGKEGFTTEDLNFVSSLANILASVMYNYLLLDEIKKEKEILALSLRIFTKLAEALESTRDEDKFLEKIVSVLRSEGFQADIRESLPKEEKEIIVWRFTGEEKEMFVVMKLPNDMKASFDELKPVLDNVYQVCETGFRSKLIERTYQYMRRNLLQNGRLYLAGVLGAEFIHEINSPLTNLKINIYELKSKIKDKPELKSVFESMEKSIARIYSVSESFRELLKEKGLEKTTFHISEVIQKSVEALQPIISSIARIEMDIRSDPKIKGIKPVLSQMLMNILMNSAEALMEKKKMEMSKGNDFLKISVLKEKNMCVIEVEDSGIGMSSETLKHVGKAFFSTKSSGLGLGLYLAKIAVEQHGGSLKIESELGRGTKVKIKLPCIN
jgi:nitrogen-specific signal transduction histidine kinase